MFTSIVIATFNKLEYTQQCIESIRRFTDSVSYEIIVVDNNSTDGTREWLAHQDDIFAIFNDENYGFPKACNQGMKIARGDILLLNNDTVVTKNWLSNMRAALYSDEKIGAVGTVTNAISYYQAIPVSYTSINEMHEFADSYNISNPMQWEERLKLVGYNMIIKKSVADQIGMLDERFSPGNYEDDDYSLRIRLAGYRLLLCNDTFIHHFGSISFKNNQSYGKILQTNRQKFLDKWGFDPDSAQVINQEMVRLIGKPSNQELHVLEVGARCGGTLLQVKSAYPNAKTVSVEWNETERAIAGLIGQSYDSIQQLTGCNSENFDVVIVSRLDNNFSEEQQLSELSKLLKKDGVLIVQFPNILYYRIVHDFIQGKLSKECVSYYKAADLEPLFKRIGMEQVEVHAIAGFVHQNDEPYILKLAELNGTGIQESFRIQQFIVRSTLHTRQDSLQFLVESMMGDDEIDVSQLLSFTVEEVIETLQNVAPANLAIHHRLSISAYSFGQYDWAQHVLLKAFEIDPTNDDTFHNLAVVLQAKGEHRLALDWVRMIKERSDEVEKFEAELQQIVTYRHFIEIELKHILRRIEFDIDVPSNASTILDWLNNNDERLDTILSHLHHSIMDKSKVLNCLAIASYEREEYDIILALLQKALEYESDNPDTLYNIALVLYQAGEKRLAAKYLDRIETEDYDLVAAALELKEAITR